MIDNSLSTYQLQSRAKVGVSPEEPLRKGNKMIAIYKNR
jgi:hypothetical protein